MPLVCSGRDRATSEWVCRTLPSGPDWPAQEGWHVIAEADGCTAALALGAAIAAFAFASTRGPLVSWPLARLVTPRRNRARMVPAWLILPGAIRRHVATPPVTALRAFAVHGCITGLVTAAGPVAHDPLGTMVLRDAIGTGGLVTRAGIGRWLFGSTGVAAAAWRLPAALAWFTVSVTIPAIRGVIPWTGMALLEQRHWLDRLGRLLPV